MPELAPVSTSTELSGPFAGIVHAALSRAVRAQSGAARDYVAWLRERHPHEAPDPLRRRLDSRFLTLVTTSGVAVGATAAVPGVGTILALGAIGAESLVFLEAAAFYTLAAAHVHGVDLRDGEQEERLVSTVLTGASGTALLSRIVDTDSSADSDAATTAPTSPPGRALRLPGVSALGRRVASRATRRLARRRATLALGKLAPAGVGAVIGGWGNRRLGRMVLDTVHASLGAPPHRWPVE